MLEHHIVVGGNALHSMAQPDICHAGPQSHGSCPPVPAFYSDFLPPAWQDSGRVAHHVGIGSNIQSVMDALGRKAILQALSTHTPPTGVHDLPSSMQQLPSKSARIPGAARASSSRQVLQSGTTIANLQAGDPHAIQTTPPPPPPRGALPKPPFWLPPNISPASRPICIDGKYSSKTLQKTSIGVEGCRQEDWVPSCCSQASSYPNNELEL